MAKLFDQQQLSAGAEEFEEHLRRGRVRDWTVDCQLAKPLSDLPAPARRDGNQKAAARNARGGAPAKATTRPVGPPIETPRPRRWILALAAVLLLAFVGAASFELVDRNSLTAERGGGAAVSDAPATAAANGEAAPLKAAPVASAPTSATGEVYEATIRPDGSLAPNTTPRAIVTPTADEPPQTAGVAPAVVAPAPAPDAIANVITGGGQSEATPSAAVVANAPAENPPAAKPARKRTGARAAKPNAAASNAVSGGEAATANGAASADVDAPAAAAKPVATKSAASKTGAAKTAAAKPKVTSAAAQPTDSGKPVAAPSVQDEGGLFDGAEEAVGSLTGAVRKLVGAD